MKVPVVRLKLRVRLPDGSRPYLDPVFSGNNKLKPGYAQLNGSPVHFPEGVYHLRYLKCGSRVWESIGSDAQLALIAKLKREKSMEARAAGVTVVDDESEATPQTDLQKTTADYFAEVAAHKSKKTYAAYSLTLKLFLESCSKLHLEDIERKDILAFMSHLKAKKNGPRTVANRVGYLKRFFSSISFDWPLSASDRPRYTQKAVSVYNNADIQALLAEADREESEMLQFFLFTGAREQEVQFATWRDLDLVARTFTVREKLDLGFTPKD